MSDAIRADDGAAGAEAGAREINAREMKNDPRAMRALAHPVRVALIEELAILGELTATQAAELVGESPANCSFHLRQLAKYGFVEESGTGQGRNRPWRAATRAMNLDMVGAEAEPETAVAMTQLTSMFLTRSLDRVQTWWRTQRAYPKRWRRAAQMKQAIWWVTPEELEALGEELTALASRYYERSEQPELRPAGALPVEFLTFAYPVQAPPPDDEAALDADRDDAGDR